MICQLDFWINTYRFITGGLAGALAPAFPVRIFTYMKNKVMMKVVLEQLGALVVTAVITVAAVAMAVGVAIIELG